LLLRFPLSVNALHLWDTSQKYRKRPCVAWFSAMPTRDGGVSTEGEPRGRCVDCLSGAGRWATCTAALATGDVRLANGGPLPPPARDEQPPGHSIGNRRSHVAADGICGGGSIWPTGRETPPCGREGTMNPCLNALACGILVAHARLLRLSLGCHQQLGLLHHGWFDRRIGLLLFHVEGSANA